MEQQKESQPQQEAKLTPKFPSESIKLPSEGKFYPPGHPLESGEIELYYPSARSEDILTSKNLITKGVVIDRFIESLIVDTNIDLNDVLLGDKNAIIVAARILAYGKDYQVKIECPSCSFIDQNINVDISEIEAKQIDFSLISAGTREFDVALPASKKTVRLRLLTHQDEKAIDSEIKQMKKLTKSQNDSEITTRLRYAIVALDGNPDRSIIKKFVDNMLSIDSLELRKGLLKVTPDVDMKFQFECKECSYSERMALPLGVSFFWPSGFGN